jgi:Ca2+-binding RTX toxin-like protein
MSMQWLWIRVAGAAILLLAVSSSGLASGADSDRSACAQGPTAIGGTIVGTPCDDTIVAPPGVAAVDGGRGDDTIVAGPITAALDCTAGCFLDIGSQTFEGGPGNDVVFGERGNDRLFGGEGSDQLFGGIGDDLVKGGPGADRLSGGFGADTVEGEAGGDYVRGDATADHLLAGGTDADTLSFSTGVTPGFFNNHPPNFSAVPGLPSLGGERGVYLDLAGAVSDNGVAPFGGGVDKFVAADFESVIGTPFADYIEGSNLAETIYGGGGGDVILGRDGDDVLFGGADGDDLDGGLGSDSGNGNAGDDHCEDLGSETSCEPAENGGGVAMRDPSKIAAGMLAPENAAFTQLYLVGSGAADEITAIYSPGSVTFERTPGSAPFDTSADASGGCGPHGSSQIVCSLAKPLDSVVIAGLGGDDALVTTGFPAAVSVVIAGGEGGDSLTGGELSEDVLADGPDEDGPGEDTLSALGRDDALLNNGGLDQLSGGLGNDLFLSDSICDGDGIAGGPGRDNASWAKFDPPGAPGVAARIDPGDAGRPGAGGAPSCGGGPLGTLTEVEDLEGSPGDDVFAGGGGENQLLGWAGADAFSAGAGEDRILANSGDFDPSIVCGPDTDTALIDHPPHGDVAAADCENVREADADNFRIGIQPPIPPIPAPPTAGDAPPTTPPGGRKPSPKPSLSSCVASSRSGPLRCAVRPRSLRLGALGRLERIGWRHWDSRRATGFGRLTIVLGRRAPQSRVRARIRVSRPESCEFRRWYTRLTVSYGRGYRKTFVRGAIAETPCG